MANELTSKQEAIASYFLRTMEIEAKIDRLHEEHTGCTYESKCCGLCHKVRLLEEEMANL